MKKKEVFSKSHYFIGKWMLLRIVTNWRVQVSIGTLLLVLSLTDGLLQPEHGFFFIGLYHILCQLPNLLQAIERYNEVEIMDKEKECEYCERKI